jgi:hypothetical protein
MRLAFAPFLLAACQQAAPTANQAAAAPAPPADADVTTAERLVRAKLGPADIRFVDARRSASAGVPIVCGAFDHGGGRQRYVVVNGEEAFVEPQMLPGEMDRAVREFCMEPAHNASAAQQGSNL